MASFTPSEASPGANAQLCWNIFLANVKNKAEQSEKKKIHSHCCFIRERSRSRYGEYYFSSAAERCRGWEIVSDPSLWYDNSIKCP